MNDFNLKYKTINQIILAVFKFELMLLACKHNVGTLNSNANLNWVSILNEELKSQYSNTYLCSLYPASIPNLSNYFMLNSCI